MEFCSTAKKVKNTEINLLLLSEAMVCKLSGEYYSNDSFLYFLSDLKKHFKSISLCIPVFGDNSSGKSFEGPIPLDLVEVVETYPYENVLIFYKKLPIVFAKNFLKFLYTVQKVDVVFLRIPAMNAFLVSFLAMICKKPIVCYIVGDEGKVVKEGNKYRGLSKIAALTAAYFHRFLYKRIVHLSRVSFFLDRTLQKTFSAPENKSYFIFTNLIKEESICIKNKRHLNHPIRLLYVGRLSHEKGLEYLLRAVKILISQGVDLQFSVCGDGPDRKTAEHLCGVINLQNRVDFLGHMRHGSKLNKVYKNSDIFVLPSLSEGVPKVLLEAMAQGLPIITTDVGGIPDIIKNHENGILVAPKSPEAIADAVKLIVKDERLRKNIIKNGYAFVRAHTAEKQAKTIADMIYKHIEL